MLATFQGGGSGSDDKDMANPFNRKRFTVCIFLSMEIVSLSERVMVVDVGKLVEIPSYLGSIPPSASFYQLIKNGVLLKHYTYVTSSSATKI